MSMIRARSAKKTWQVQTARTCITLRRRAAPARFD
jgi:hypothetical protein